MKTKTKGDVIVDDIKLGDTFYEYDVLSNTYNKVTVVSQPIQEGNYWELKVKTDKGKQITYIISSVAIEARYNPVLYKTKDK